MNIYYLSTRMAMAEVGPSSLLAIPIPPNVPNPSILRVESTSRAKYQDPGADVICHGHKASGPVSNLKMRIFDSASDISSPFPNRTKTKDWGKEVFIFVSQTTHAVLKKASQPERRVR